LNDSPFVFKDIPKKQYELIYKGSIHGFKASIFHERCGKLGSPTICFVLRERGRVFGGYFAIDWDATLYDFDKKNGAEYDSGFREDKNAFIFSLTDRTKHYQFKDFNGATHHSYNINVDRIMIWL